MPEFSIDRITELLSLIAKEPSNIYRAAKLPGWTAPTAHRYVHYCLAQGYISLDREEDDKGLSAKFYRITAKGTAFLEAAPSPTPVSFPGIVGELKEEEKKPRKEKRGTGIILRT